MRFLCVKATRTMTSDKLSSILSEVSSDLDCECRMLSEKPCDGFFVCAVDNDDALVTIQSAVHGIKRGESRIIRMPKGFNQATAQKLDGDAQKALAEAKAKLRKHPNGSPVWSGRADVDATITSFLETIMGG